MSQSKFAVCYGVHLDRQTVADIIEDINSSDQSIEELLGIDIRSDQVCELTTAEFNTLLSDLCCETFYTAHIIDEPAYIGIYLGELTEGKLLEQVEKFKEEIPKGKNYKSDTYSGSPIEDFLPEPELIIIEYST